MWSLLVFQDSGLHLLLRLPPGEFSGVVHIHGQPIAAIHGSMFIWHVCAEQVMATPISPEDQVKVQKTFDEEAGPVRLPPHCTTLPNLINV